MADHPTISIVIPSHNRARYLEQTICSALDQGYERVEAILADAGSTDGTERIIRDYESELSLVITHPGASTAQLINEAISAARGEVIGILPAGDLYLPFAMRRVAPRFAASAGCEWLTAGALWVSEQETLLERRVSRPLTTLEQALGRDADPAPLAASFWSRELLRQSGPLRSELRCEAEMELTCRLLARGYSPRVLEETISCRRTIPLSSRLRLVSQRERSQVILHYTRVAAETPAHARRPRRRSA